MKQEYQYLKSGITTQSKNQLPKHRTTTKTDHLKLENRKTGWATFLQRCIFRYCI